MKMANIIIITVCDPWFNIVVLTH